MKPDDKTERIKPVEDREENPSIERERESEAVVVHSGRKAPRADGCRAQAGRGRRPQRVLSLHFT